MSLIPLADPKVHKLRQRLRDLTALQSRISNEINEISDRLAEIDSSWRVRRRRGRKPACGTEAGYQFHRYWDKANWPLPKDDPCGCRRAHRDARRIKDQIKRAGEAS